MAVTYKSILVKKDGKLVNKLKSYDKVYQEFVKNIKEGQEVELYIEPLLDNATKAQIAKVHTMIRVIASSTGNDFGDIKTEVKERAGLGSDSFNKSFADCSKEDIELAIEACRSLADELNIIVD